MKSILHAPVRSFFVFFGTAARGALQDVKRERPKSRFAAVETINHENPAPSP